jgi:hypothetical protein
LIGISRAYGGAHSFLEISHTLTPASLLSEEEEEYDDDEPSYNEVLGVEDDEEKSRKWREHEVVKAIYESREDGLPGEETLVDFRRTIRVR